MDESSPSVDAPVFQLPLVALSPYGHPIPFLRGQSPFTFIIFVGGPIKVKLQLVSQVTPRSQ